MLSAIPVQTPASAGNVIAFNGDAGVRVEASIRNRISRNSIYANAERGISLDSATGGNNWIVAPRWDGVTSDGTTMTVTLTVRQLPPGSTATVEFFYNAPGDIPSEGRLLIASDVVPVNEDGTATFVMTVPTALCADG